MSDLKKYWLDIRALEHSLPGEVWLMSLENRARGQVSGSMAQAAGAAAAKLLYAKSHRLATEEEVGAHQARQAEMQQQVSEQRLRDRGIAIIPIEGRMRSA